MKISTIRSIMSPKLPRPIELGADSPTGGLLTAASRVPGMVLQRVDAMWADAQKKTRAVADPGLTSRQESIKTRNSA
jgi:hypothetical protein